MSDRLSNRIKCVEDSILLSDNVTGLNAVSTTTEIATWNRGQKQLRLTVESFRAERGVLAAMVIWDLTDSVDLSDMGISRLFAACAALPEEWRGAHLVDWMLETFQEEASRQAHSASWKLRSRRSRWPRDRL